MPSKISQIELNGVTYDVRDAGAVKLANIGEVDEIVVLSTVDKEVVASGTTLAEIFDRIDTATIVENVQDGEWIVNIVNSDLTVDLANYYSKSKVDELIANAMNSVVSYLTPAQQAALASGITVAKVTGYDSHIADTDIHLAVGERATLVKISDLSNYYTKSDTYSKGEVDSLVSTIPKFDIKVVDQLPTTDISTSTIYLVRSSGSSPDMYDEYIYVSGAWEKLGTQSISEVVDVQDANGNSLVNQNHVAIIPSNLFLVTATITGQSPLGYYIGTLDKTNAEIVAAYNAGKSVWGRVSDGSTGYGYFPLSEIEDSGSHTYPEITFKETHLDADLAFVENRVKISAGDAVSNSCTLSHFLPDFVGHKAIPTSGQGEYNGQYYYYWYTQGSKLTYSGKEITFADYNSTTQAATFYYVNDNKEYASITVYNDSTIGTNLTTLGVIHKHENKTTLDKFGESSGVPTFDGNPIGGGNVDDVVDEDNVSLVDANKIAHIPNSNIDDDIVDVCAMLEGADVFSVGDDYLGVDSNTTLVF